MIGDIVVGVIVGLIGAALSYYWNERIERLRRVGKALLSLNKVPDSGWMRGCVEDALQNPTDDNTDSALYAIESFKRNEGKTT